MYVNFKSVGSRQFLKAVGMSPIKIFYISGHRNILETKETEKAEKVMSRGGTNS